MKTAAQLLKQFDKINKEKQKTSLYLTPQPMMGYDK